MIDNNMSRKQLSEQIDTAMPEIRRLYIEEHLGTSEIARIMNLNVKSVAIRLYREKLLRSKKEAQKNRRTVPDLDVIKMYNDGSTISTIAEALGIEKQSVFQVLHRNGVMPNRLDSQAVEKSKNRITEEEKSRIILLYNGGHPANEIAKIMDIGHQTTLNVLKVAGIQVLKGIATHTKRHLYVGKNGNTLMRSSWEVEIAKMFDYFQIEWQYEPKTFNLSNGKQYTPDFHLCDFDVYVEVKGHWTALSINKFSLFTKEYPDITTFICRHPGWFGQFLLLQKLLEKKYGYNVAKMTEEERVNFIKEQSLMLYAEMAEVLQEIPWKKHKVYDNAADKEKYLNELIDVLVFLLNLLAAYDIDEQDIINKTRTIELKNFIRQKAGYHGNVGEDLLGTESWKQQRLEKDGV